MENVKSFYRGKKVLVTGGAGFIGSHIAQRLCSYEAEVTILDDLSSGSLTNICEFAHGINFIAGSITNYKACIKATKKQDIVFHTAAFISVPLSLKHPALCEKINVEGTANILETCEKQNVKSFVFSSSSAVYGERKGFCRETDAPCPQSPYAQSKLEGEALCKSHAESGNMNTSCLRYFNVYGPRQSAQSEYSGVIAKFKHNLVTKKPIVIYGNGKQKRDFVHVSEVVDANLLIGTLPSLRGEIFNIATGKSISLLKLLHKLEEETSKKPTAILFKPARKGDIYSSQADCTKFRDISAARCT